MVSLRALAHHRESLHPVHVEGRGQGVLCLGRAGLIGVMTDGLVRLIMKSERRGKTENQMYVRRIQDFKGGGEK